MFSNTSFNSGCLFKTSKRITFPHKYEGKKFFKGTHLVEDLGDISYVKQSLRRLKSAIEIMNDIISTSGPSDKFKNLFKCQEKIDSTQVMLVYDFFQNLVYSLFLQSLVLL